MRHFIITLFVIFLGVLFYVLLFGYSLQLNETQLQEKINAKLPYSKRYYVLLESTLAHAQVKLKDNRIHVRFDANLKIPNPERLLKNQAIPAWISLLSGQVEAIAKPEFRSQTGEVFLSEIKIIGLNVDGINDSKKLYQSAQRLVIDYFATHPIYTLKANDFKKTLAKKFLKKVTVTNNKLVLFFSL